MEMAAAEAGEKRPVADMDGEKKASSESKAAPREFTVENVDKVLEEVRPCISDGGNVAVVSVNAETMGVTLALRWRVELRVVDGDDEDGHRARAARGPNL